jgi:hypothetical protein
MGHQSYLVRVENLTLSLGPPAMLAKIEGGVINYYHGDHLSPRLTTDLNGSAQAAGAQQCNEALYADAAAIRTIPVQVELCYGCRREISFVHLHLAPLLDISGIQTAVIVEGHMLYGAQNL